MKAQYDCLVIIKHRFKEYFDDFHEVYKPYNQYIKDRNIQISNKAVILGIWKIK